MIFALPTLRKSIELLVRNIGQVQEYLKRPMMFENVSSYRLSNNPDDRMGVYIQVARRSGCKVLLM